jgi:hypothetical protein
MSMNPEELQEHCDLILQSRRIRRKIVVLCEGPRFPIDTDRPSPQTYRRMEQLPDANFYKACIPKWWSQQRPEFFTCGDRVDVIDTYFALQRLSRSTTPTYLDPTKLFAIVDLDINRAKLAPSYPFSDTEAIFQDLYHQGTIKQSQTTQHPIWVTGLIHKEAYFLAPEVETTLNQHPIAPSYKGTQLLLRDLYLDMADAAVAEADLAQNFAKVTHRVSHCPNLDCTDLTGFIQSWKQTFQTAAAESDRTQLIKALLTLKKSKDFWRQIEPPTDWSRSPADFRDQLSLAIGNFYAQQPSDSHLHLPAFFNALYQKI